MERPHKSSARPVSVSRLAMVVLVVLGLTAAPWATAQPRARELGIPFDGRPGPHNAIVIVATDAPLLPHQLKRLCNRVPLGIGRVGGYGSNSSGDLFLAFSTAHLQSAEAADVQLAPMLSNDAIDPFFLATVEATEEAIVNALVAARTMTGINGNTVYSLPHEALIELLRRYTRTSAASPSAWRTTRE